MLSRAIRDRRHPSVGDSAWAGGHTAPPPDGFADFRDHDDRQSDADADKPGGVPPQDAAKQQGTSDSEVQRRVITLAKLTPERAWLAQASSVALVQACNDARRAYRNWFDSLSGQRKGRRMGHPGFRRKHGRQSIRLTRNGFALHESWLYVAKVGDVKVRWSRELPSEPSSVTVIREADGRYYASFVVERGTAPLPPCDREVGVDVGLDRLAVTSDGEIIANPRFLRAKKRQLAGAQRAMLRKRKGSANRARARHRVAVLHRKVREARLDHAHKTALRLVRDNQAVYAEDLAVSGLARTRLAKSIHDAGWSQLLRLLAEKAEYHGREFHRIGRFEPTSADSATSSVAALSSWVRACTSAELRPCRSSTCSAWSTESVLSACHAVPPLPDARPDGGAPAGVVTGLPSLSRAGTIPTAPPVMAPAWHHR
jgi:putative transposase